MQAAVCQQQQVAVGQQQLILLLLQALAAALHRRLAALLLLRRLTLAVVAAASAAKRYQLAFQLLLRLIQQQQVLTDMMMMLRHLQRSLSMQSMQLLHQQLLQVTQQPSQHNLRPLSSSSSSRACWRVRQSLLLPLPARPLLLLLLLVMVLDLLLDHLLLLGSLVLPVLVTAVATNSARASLTNAPSSAFKRCCSSRTSTRRSLSRGCMVSHQHLAQQ
jgi:hypothetical protein